MFDRVADTYDRVGVDFFKPIAERLVALCAPRPGERALDVGCGRGAALFPLARAVGRTGHVIGIDVAPRMVQATMAEAAGYGLDVDVRLGDASSPDLPGQSFDLVVASLMLFFLPDARAGLKAWRSLLVEGGRIGVSSFGDYSDGWREIDDILRRNLAEPMPGGRAQGATSPFSSDAGVEQLLEDAGLSGIRTESVTVPVRFRDPDQWFEWSWSVGQRRTWESIAQERRQGVHDTVREQLNRCRDRAGEIWFEQVARLTIGFKT